MIDYTQIAARRQFKTPNVTGAGAWARVSTCGPIPIVRLFSSEADCIEAERAGRKCAAMFCKMEHRTERVRALNDAEKQRLIPDLGEHERASAAAR